MLINLYSENKDIITTLIIEKDEGIYDAWNKGIKVAKNDWICFLGADDTMKSDALLNYNNFIVKNQNLEFVSSKIILINKKNKKRTIGQNWNWDKFSRYMNISHPGSMHSKKLFKNNSFNTKYKIAGDYEFLLRIGKNLKAGFINKVTVEMSSGGISNQNINVLKESLKAKIIHTRRQKLLILLEYYFAIIKWNLKKIIRYS